MDLTAREGLLNTPSKNLQNKLDECGVQVVSNFLVTLLFGHQLVYEKMFV